MSEIGKDKDKGKGKEKKRGCSLEVEGILILINQESRWKSSSQQLVIWKMKSMKTSSSKEGGLSSDSKLEMKGIYMKV